MSGKRERPVVSRQWSCSELVEGHGELLAAKKERESDDELQLKIKDIYFLLCIYTLMFFRWPNMLCIVEKQQEYEEELARLKNEVVPQLH